MEKTETEKVTTSRDRIREMMRSRYPDRTFEGDNEHDELDDLVVSELERNGRELDELRTANQQIVDLFNRDPLTGEYLMRRAAAQDTNPIGVMLDMFGPDLLDAMQSDEGRAKISEATAKHMERKAKEQAGEQERADNYEKSIKGLVAFADEHGLSKEQAAEIFDKINQIGWDITEGIYSRETIQMVYDGMNFSSAVEKARAEGERDGRNARIDERLTKVKKPIDMPPSVTGRGGSVPEATAPAPKDSFFDGIRDEVSRGYGRKSTFSKK